MTTGYKCLGDGDLPPAFLARDNSERMGMAAVSVESQAPRGQYSAEVWG